MNEPLCVIHRDLLYVMNHVFFSGNFICSEVSKESENIDYGAYSFKINDYNIKFRIAKITPKKVGHFVAIWKRDNNGNTQPFDFSDNIDFVIISVRKEGNFGLFIFPTMILIKNNIISKNNKGGKRGIRVYPPLDETVNKQSKKTQEWQIRYFLNIPPQDNRIDLTLLKKLLCLNL